MLSHFSIDDAPIPLRCKRCPGKGSAAQESSRFGSYLRRGKEVDMKSMTSRRRVSILLALVSIAALVAMPVYAPGKVEKIMVSTSGGPVGGTAYIVYSTMAAIVSQYSDKVRVSCEGGGGTAENYERIEPGKLDFGNGIDPTCYEAYTGTGAYEGKPHKHLRFLTFHHYAVFWFCTLKKSGFNNLSDLKGKRVSPGMPGSSSTILAERVLKTNGLDVQKDCKVTYLTYSDMVKALKDGTIDAGMIGGGHLTGLPSALLDLVSTHDVKIIPLVDKGAPIRVGWTVIPKGTVKGTDVDTPTWTILSFCIVRDTVPEDVVYEIIKQWLTHLPEFYKGHAVCKHMTLDRVFNAATIPVHRGAVKYYKEIGIWDKRPAGVESE